MIVRILNGGQYELADSDLETLNQLDASLEAAVESGEEAGVAAALAALLERVRELGEPVADDVLVDSDLILPDDEADLAQIRQWLGDAQSTDGLIPG